MQNRPNGDIEADIGRLEAGIRQLKMQYDMFFAGALPREPVELKAELEGLIRRYANAPMMKYAHRFHLNSLASRLNTLSELCTKTLREAEEGNRAAIQPPEPPSGEKVLSRCRIGDAQADQELLKHLHARYLEARRRFQDPASSTVTFEKFKDSVASQVGRLREQSGCDHVELRLVLRERKVLLKARPARD